MNWKTHALLLSRVQQISDLHLEIKLMRMLIQKLHSFVIELSSIMKSANVTVN